MKLYKISAVLLLAVIGSTNSNAQKKEKGFVSLFDGKTTTGWHSYGRNLAGQGWKVEEGALHLVPTGNKDDSGDLVTNKEYGNFHLKVDWKVAPGANSGILFHIKEDAAKYHQTYSTGPEVQVIDNDGHPDGKITKHRAGDLYDLVKSSSEPVKPVGEWNTAEIISNRGKLEIKLNGVTVVSTTQFDDNWKALIAGSKFAKWEGFGTFTSGKISLQDHGNEVWYRNIMIKEL
ncbi:protein of unknown function [Pedobacter westerhofensis]|uniref:3-keto-alpha-glucoside-1,2-lyase/3-keto-2-hydroxy-glucal hydratase domain-containing protein n=1 Tax=Pedobacter westerhofensis TaxID=425512 RepID=A0A521BVV4_9SPHI|nr:DUF1080 domain-containing protein [Pedobacter westerhofensis]SMO51309.1 protein of unknown function [Pedobacter westerhofensis]